MARKFFVGGNFKMNGSAESLRKIASDLNTATLDPNVEVIISPPALYIVPLLEHVKSNVQIAAQNVHQLDSGAYTGEISICQLKDVGLKWVILGHSERRQYFHESSELIAEKTLNAIKQGVSVILCVGENLEERESGTTLAVIQSQLDPVIAVLTPEQWANVVIAYEPVWAIGTGKVATPEQAQDTHADIRKYIASKVSPEVADAVRIIYGGSVNAKNAKSLASTPDIDGFLVGGASLKPEFIEIINVNLESKL